MIEDLSSLLEPEFYTRVLSFLWSLWPVILPIFLLSLGLNTWLSYKRREWIQNQGSVLLEIKLPREILKSPKAMEMVLEGIYEPASGNLGDAYLKGRVRDWFSLEIASLGGEIKFFIWALPKWKKTIEARIYSQYPGAEVFEVEDYMRPHVFDPNTMNLWGSTIQLVKDDAYPIKTYVDYELEKGNKEQEEIVDPIVSLIEYLGTIKEGEQAWVQILIQAHRKEGLLDNRIIVKPDWKGKVKEEIKKIIEKESHIKADEDKPATLQNLTTIQSETIDAIERNAVKPACDTMIRMVYFAPKDIFDGSRIGGMLGSMRPFGSHNLNGFKPKWMSGVDYPWKDFRDQRKIAGQKMHLDAFKRRSFFNVPYRHLNGKPFILTVEELATIFHFPGTVATTPTLNRVPSKKAEAPANLPL
ncbi:MAG: hypothetical protein WDZ64_00335 [Parcubacteria group bacterium]